ncbi:MAG: murein biosynthesis integral membrane protein MurJ [Treponema berlinense]|uniref:murein biosynthesis integral membrane protein MurJ n=1 Tax=Treponema berlinense TaxID=225004 RepID=UPI0023556B07|nr:murein biosynthesis integral membrane protein MurJ [Treponema berlinense]MCI5541856.1 murein biosynthesis integral membrane protein MurJ [Treponema berlinense]MDY3708627.1 murein biosynthesis integral membrane protein MurJ [Treponema berlinense]
MNTENNSPAKNIADRQKKSNTKKSLLASGLSLSFFTLCSRILGLVREMTKASFLGTSKFADAFGIAFMIPNLLRRLFAENSISVAFIPTFRGYLEDSATSGKDSDEFKKTKEFLNSTITLISFCTTVVVILGIAFSPLIIPLFLDESDSVLTAEAVLLTRIMFPYLFVISLAAFFQGILNGVKIFSPSGFTPVLFNSIVIACTYIFTPLLTKNVADAELRAQMAARAMSFGVLIGGCVQAIFQLPFVIKTGWFCHFTSLKKAFKNPGTKKVIALVGPTVIGMAAYQLNDVISTALAGKAGTGIVSSLQYSLRLQELILGIFAVSIGTVILPDLSGLAKTQKWENFNRLLSQAIKIIALISIPVTFYSLVCGKEIISLVYKSKNFNDESVQLTLTAFRFHIAGLFFIAMNRVVAPAFYAQGNTKSPTLAGILGLAINMIFALILIKPMSGGGIALALTLGSLANSILLFVFLKKNKQIDVKAVVGGTILYSIKMAVLSVIAAIPATLVKNATSAFFAGRGRLVEFGGTVVLTAIVFAFAGILLLLITKDPVLASAKNMVLKKVKK